MSEFDGYRSTYERDINDAIGFTGKSQDFFTRVKADCLSGLFAKTLSARDGLRVLDVGCGSGAIHPMLFERTRGLQLTGADVAEDTIAGARDAHPGVPYDIYDGETLPYPADSFDVAYAICVMHHVSPVQWAAFMAEMRRVVSPGGIVVIIEHNPLNPLTRHIVNTCPFDRNAVLLRGSLVLALMRDAGMNGASCRCILFTPFDGAFFRRLDAWLAPIPFGAQYIAVGHVPELER